MAYTLTINIIGNGVVNVTPLQETYESGTFVILSAAPSEGYLFSEWSGNLNGNTNPVAILMDSNKVINATFIVKQYAVSITSQYGTVIVDPYKDLYNHGDVISIQSIPNPGWMFSGWTGDINSTNNPISVIVNKELSVIANYSQIEYTINTSVVGQGSIILDPQKSSYYYGENVKIRAVGSNGWIFSKWIGLDDQFSDVEITITNNLIIQAIFVQSSRLLNNVTRYLPRWMEIRKNPSSVGARLLNLFAIEFEDIEKYLQESLDNCFISTANLEAIDIVWKSDCNSIDPVVTAIHNGSNITLSRVNTIPEFYLGINDIYIIDTEKYLLYTKKEYDHLYVDGVEVEQYLHHVWNHFDEFGLLLDTPRLYGENNRDYKERLLAVFRAPANATKRGCIHGIARHLGLLKYIDWPDDSKPIYFISPGITKDFIWIDWQPAGDFVVTINSYGLVRVNPISDIGSGVARKIYYIDRVKVNQLWDEEIKDLLYNPDGTAKLRLKYIAQNIQRQAPIMWDEFKWDEGYWDVVERSMNGISYVPNIWDADIEKWRGVRI